MTDSRDFKKEYGLFLRVPARVPMKLFLTKCIMFG